MQPTLRCHQTIQPLARDRLLGIEPLAALGVDGDPSELLELFWDRQLPNTVWLLHRTGRRQVYTRYLPTGTRAPRAHQLTAIPQRPIRRRLTDLAGLVVSRGGEYCFIPSLSALRWLSELDT